jgi:3-oxoacyl-[acyl-carrier protein] reductase
MINKQVVWVTGASRGIGRAIAIELAKNDFIVVGNGRKYDPAIREKGLFEVKDTIEKNGGTFLPLQGDISQISQHTKIVTKIMDNYGRLDLLVNNAGTGPLKRVDILQTTPASFDYVFSVNARGPFFLTQLVANEMIQQKARNPQNMYCIIFISSISAHVSSPSRAEYCVSKAAISHMARMYAHRLADFGINVYEIQPGIIKTDMTAEVEEKYNKLIEQDLIPQKRWGYPEDVAKATLALAKGYFAYSTGMQVQISGGMNIQKL